MSNAKNRSVAIEKDPEPLIDKLSDPKDWNLSSTLLSNGIPITWLLSFGP